MNTGAAALLLLVVAVGLANLAVLSLAVGNLIAIMQTNVKRLLAYSTIAHMGFMLLGIGSGVVGSDTVGAVDAYAASLFYVS